MDFDWNEHQQITKNMAKKFLANECPSAFVREMATHGKGYTPELWKKMADLGFMGIMFPEEYGGSGGSFLDLTVLLYEMGYACMPGPFFTTAVLGGITLLEAGSAAQKESLLPRIASGESIVTLAWTEQAGTYTLGDIGLQAKRQGDEYVLSGTKLFVPDAGAADVVICACRTGGGRAKPENAVSLLLVDPKSPGVKLVPLATMAGDKQYEVSFDQVRVPKANLVGQENRGWPVLKSVLLKAAVAKCVEAAGVAQKALDMTVQYTKERKQFGALIATFQAVQHHCANLLTYAETARLMANWAAWRVSEGLPHEVEASMCKAWVGEATRKAVALGHQVIGGMAFMEEHDLPLFFRRAKANEIAFGDGDFHRELVAQALDL